MNPGGRTKGKDPKKPFLNLVLPLPVLGRKKNCEGAGAEGGDRVVDGSPGTVEGMVPPDVTILIPPNRPVRPLPRRVNARRVNARRVNARGVNGIVPPDVTILILPVRPRVRPLPKVINDGIPLGTEGMVDGMVPPNVTILVPRVLPNVRNVRRVRNVRNVRPGPVRNGIIPPDVISLVPRVRPNVRRVPNLRPGPVRNGMVPTDVTSLVPRVLVGPAGKNICLFPRLAPGLLLNNGL